MKPALRSGLARTELGTFRVALGDRGLVYLGLGPDPDGARLRSWAEVHLPGRPIVSDPGATSDACEQIAAWARGDLRCFDLDLELHGTPFQRACWNELLRIPYGSTITYGELARRIGKSGGASRAVGQANGANPIPIVVPCHRVVARSGLGGFGGGVELKRRMLELEGALLPCGT